MFLISSSTESYNGRIPVKLSKILLNNRGNSLSQLNKLNVVSGDGHVDPYSLAHAFAIGARTYGAEFYMPAPVRGLSQKASGEWDVETDHGTIHAKRIINAAGNFE